MKKCDVIIPVYNSPDWVKMCVYSVIVNTEKNVLNKIIIVDDCSNEFTKDCLNKLKNKYGEIIDLQTNVKNLGFVKTCNKALKISKAPFKLLLNSDCLLSKNTISKLIDHINKNPKIGLICPISSNAANLSLEMFDGFTYSQMNKLLERKFKGKTFDACTVVGNCLLITQDCIDSVGFLDEIYGMGYGEETDYQFKSMEKGFEAKVAIDTYVFHKSEASFGTSEKKKERLEKNRKIFFDRWGKQYKELSEKYSLNDPIEYINNNLTETDKIIKSDTVIYLLDIVQNAGGVHVVIDLINYLAINNISINLLYNNFISYKEIMIFNPIHIKMLESVKMKQIVSTIYSSTYLAKEISKLKKVPLINFVQGYETLFENGAIYGIAELTYKLADYNLTISDYLKKELKDNFNAESFVIKNGIQHDLIYRKNENKKAKSITMVLRNSVMKGDWILMDIIKKINNQFNNVTLNLIYINEYVEFPAFTNKTISINKYLGPLNRMEIYNILRSSDIYIDASLSEGFGLTPLEALSAGAVPIVSNSFGINEYLVNDKNSIIIEQVNNSDKYIEALKKVFNDTEYYCKLKSNNYETSSEFDYDKIIQKYIDYFCINRQYVEDKKEYLESEKIIIEAFTRRARVNNNTKGTVKTISKLIPKRIKNKLKRIITSMYNTYEH